MQEVIYNNMIKIANERTAFSQTLQYHFDGNGWSQKWEEKFDASRVVMTEQLQKLETIRQQVLGGQLSPIAYHACKNMFSVKTLSSYTGISKRHIKKHLKPKNFNQLDENTLKIYAEVFNISIEEYNKIHICL